MRNRSLFFCAKPSAQSRIEVLDRFEVVLVQFHFFALLTSTLVTLSYLRPYTPYYTAHDQVQSRISFIKLQPRISLSPFLHLPQRGCSSNQYQVHLDSLEEDLGSLQWSQSPSSCHESKARAKFVQQDRISTIESGMLKRWKCLEGLNTETYLTGNQIQRDQDGGAR